MNRHTGLPSGGTPDAREACADSFAQARMRRLYDKVLLATIGLIALLPVASFAIDFLITKRFYFLPTVLFFKQDVVPTLILIILLVTLKFVQRPQPTYRQHTETINFYLSMSVIAISISALLVLLCYYGHYLIFFGRDLSRDEQMANFDAYIFAQGRLFWPIPPFWRPFAPALNLLYTLPIGNYEAWVSAYLPVNAALRGAMGLLNARSLTSPLLVGIGFLALWWVGGRLWPKSPAARAVTLVLYVGSPQVLVTGMTAFAMTGHLAFNLVWLALFLADRRATHASAAVIGFLATGLHQPLFHPLFILPFLGLLAFRRRWPLLAYYVTCYALIGAFWYAWPIWISAHGVGPTPTHGVTAVSFLARLLNTLREPAWGALGVMALNLLRFAVWQHLFLLPLLALGLVVAWRGNTMARALAIGFLLPIPVMFVLLPLQGNGWGYRYMHGVIGNACLLGGYGWQALEAEGLSLRAAFRAMSLATFLVLLPLRALQARLWVAPYHQVDAEIAASRADFAIVGTDVQDITVDLVLNRPDLSNRPIRLDSRKLHVDDMRTLCARGSITFFYAAQMRPIDEFLLGTPREDSAHDLALERAARRLGCSIVPAPGDTVQR